MAMIDCSIVVSTFGDPKWKNQAQERALPSARSFGIPVLYNHGNTLHEARNAGLYQVETEFVCHLDADDELDPYFFEYMFKEDVDGDLRPPSVNHVYQQVTYMPQVVGKSGVHTHTCVAECLEDGNWLVVGTVARTQLLKDVGGWKEWGNFEDWDLWMRCWVAGASITPVPSAIYRAYSTSQGRCRNMSQQEIDRICNNIRRANMPCQ